MTDSKERGGSESTATLQPLDSSVIIVNFSPLGKRQAMFVRGISVLLLLGLLAPVGFVLWEVLGNLRAGANWILPILVYPIFIWSLSTSIQNVTKALTDHKQLLRFTSGGIIFPFGNAWQLRGRRWRRWEDLRSVSLASEVVSAPEQAAQIFLEFRDGSKVGFLLCSMTLEDREKFLVSLDIWAPSGVLPANFADLRNSLSDALTLAGKLSYTAIWNNELSRRFALATFKPLPPGSRLQNGRFEVTGQLSFGGFSAVYDAVARGGAQVVLKELAWERIKNLNHKQNVVSHLEREIALLSRLEHKKICRILDTFVEGDRYYIVLEKIPGTTLRQLVLRDGPLAESMVLELAVQMVEIFSYLHNLEPPVVHRDFTPDNLILKENCSLVLIDFNAATETLSNVTATIVGKHCYMPPEQVRGHSEVASDYYAMGCSLFFLLIGQDPVPLSPIDRKKLTGKSLQPKLIELIFKMTAQDAKERPSLSEISEVLKECC